MGERHMNGPMGERHMNGPMRERSTYGQMGERSIYGPMGERFGERTPNSHRSKKDKFVLRPNCKDELVSSFTYVDVCMSTSCSQFSQRA